MSAQCLLSGVKRNAARDKGRRQRRRRVRGRAHLPDPTNVKHRLIW